MIKFLSWANSLDAPIWVQVSVCLIQACLGGVWFLLWLVLFQASYYIAGAFVLGLPLAVLLVAAWREYKKGGA